MTRTPLTPPDCDLRGMPYMPLDTVRLFDSDFYALSTGEEFKAGLSLWAKAFLQVPAGSLPNNEKLLAHLSGSGKDWPKVRTMALHGWFECSDGRLYHKVVAEKAKETWDRRQAHRESLAAAREALAEKRAAKKLSGSGNSSPPNGHDADTGPVTVTVTATATEPVTATVRVSDTEPIATTATVTGLKGREGKGREEKGKEDARWRTRRPPFNPFLEIIREEGAATDEPDPRTLIGTRRVN